MRRVGAKRLDESCCICTNCSKQKAWVAEIWPTGSPISANAAVLLLIQMPLKVDRHLLQSPYHAFILQRHPLVICLRPSIAPRNIPADQVTSQAPLSPTVFNRPNACFSSETNPRTASVPLCSRHFRHAASNSRRVMANANAAWSICGNVFEATNRSRSVKS